MVNLNDIKTSTSVSEICKVSPKGLERRMESERGKKKKKKNQKPRKILNESLLLHFLRFNCRRSGILLKKMFVHLGVVNFLTLRIVEILSIVKSCWRFLNCELGIRGFFGWRRFKIEV